MPDALPNGLYKLAFETKSGGKYGVAYMQGGRLRGGDSSCAYMGTYKTGSELFSAEMSVTHRRHVPSAISAVDLHD